jgi:hypothetical protein
MRHDAPFLVKRFAPMIGRPESKRRITVAYQAYRLADAIEWARGEQEHAERCSWVRRPALWIERRGQSAGVR